VTDHSLAKHRGSELVFTAVAGLDFGLVSSMSVTVRLVQWRTAMLRPVAMPTVECPCVKDWDTGKTGMDWLCINHCLPCASAIYIHLDMEARTGEVRCAAS